MSESSAQRRYTIAEYLEYERKAESKHEYHDGLIVAMAGGTFKHALIQSAIFRAAGRQLEGKPCVPLGSDLRIFVPTHRRVFYPDLSILCGPPEFDPSAPGDDAVVNPALIAEVLSPSTESFDRTLKFKFYMALPSLREYVLISTEQPRVETYLRQDDGSWSFRFADGMQETIELRSVGVTLAMVELYKDVAFERPTLPGSVESP